MSNDQYYSIGQVAKICNISIQTLRYYDKIGLVIPNHTDKLSGYRYYSNRDLLYVKIVQDMKMLQFSLDEIGEMLKNDSLDSLFIKLESKQKEMLDEIKRLEKTVKSIEQRTARVVMLQELGNGLKDLDVLVELKRFPDRHVVSDRGRYACGMEPSIIKFTKLFGKVDASDLITNPIMTVYHENIMTFDRAESDLEFCIILNHAGPETVNTRIIPENDYITALYCGIPNDVSCKRIYGKLQKWIENNGYIENGPSIEQYLVDMAHMMKPEEFIVELQVPVRKALTL
ncbi:MerR family transcriptional regulator [Paenibacillus harenae]|uniref:MerR family transcriptional regulator n=1 Tax=Paenibacillus harenae TaxID=306543 RepID=UPI00278F45CC|nr:MerR family transcriptional regulator [Paenibacillus harenae]MDQ0062151.1 DNA-binding transcriptional MerR regulator/effector-binding domain-containing protein [Paenibacillus harenae]